MIEAQLEGSLAVELIDTIRSVSDKPVLLCAAPFLSERMLEEEEEIRSQKRYRTAISSNSWWLQPGRRGRISARATAMR